MVNSLSPVVIDNGSDTTRAGFASEDLPSLVFNSKYAIDSSQNYIFGDENIDKHPNDEIMTIMDNGIPYNTEGLRHNWQYAFDNLDGGNSVSSEEYPLMVTEPVWNTNKNKASMAQIAFESLKVPLFSIVKTPLSQLYHMGRSSGLVIDIGSSVTSVTPILDGIIQSKCTVHSKYAGEFVNLHCLRSLESKVEGHSGSLDYLLPQKYAGNASESFKQYHVTHNLLSNFKQTMLHLNEAPPGVPASNAYYSSQIQHQHPASYQLPNGSHVSYNNQDLSMLSEPLFAPSVYQLPGISLPEPTFDLPGTHGLSNLIIYAIKNLEANFMASVANENQNSTSNSRFNEILRQLFHNTLITGGGSLIPGMSDRICGDLSRLAPQVLPNYMITGSYKLYISPLRNHSMGDINDTFDKKFGAWLGAANLANMLRENVEEDSSTVGIALDNWFVSKADYEELGEDYVVEKFK